MRRRADDHSNAGCPSVTADTDSSAERVKHCFAVGACSSKRPCHQAAIDRDAIDKHDSVLRDISAFARHLAVFAFTANALVLVVAVVAYMDARVFSETLGACSKPASAAFLMVCREVW